MPKRLSAALEKPSPSASAAAGWPEKRCAISQMSLCPLPFLSKVPAINRPDDPNKSTRPTPKEREGGDSKRQTGIIIMVIIARLARASILVLLEPPENGGDSFKGTGNLYAGPCRTAVPSQRVAGGLFRPRRVPLIDSFKGTGNLYVPKTVG